MGIRAVVNVVFDSGSRYGNLCARPLGWSRIFDVGWSFVVACVTRACSGDSRSRHGRSGSNQWTRLTLPTVINTNLGKSMGRVTNRLRHALERGGARITCARNTIDRPRTRCY